MLEEGAAASAASAGAACCARSASATATAAATRHRLAPAPPKPLTEEELFLKKTLDQLNAEMPLGDVMFDYDMSAVKDDQRALLQKNVDWMRRWTTTRVTIEGHADARGTNEYNLALGERRGNAVKDYMVSLGIAADRMTVISKGEEAPVCTEMTDACYARNRRGHFIITAK